MIKTLNSLLFFALLTTPLNAQQLSGLPSLPATSSTLGSIKPDNSSIVVGPTGTLSSIGSQPASQYIAPQALAGCGIEYVSGLTYTVGACTYSINGTVYNSPMSNITLATADPTNPRIDVVFVDTTQVVQSITGTPAATPQQPVVDPSTQLELTFVLVPATATTPGNTVTVPIYLEGTEWTGSVGGTNSARVNLTSTSNPYLGTHDTEFGVGGTVTTTTFAQYTDPSAGTVNMSNYNSLVFYMRNKAAWPKTRSITVQWFNGSTPTGIPVVLSNGAFGFNATTNTTAYQQVSIPVSTFGIPGVPVTSLRFTVTGSGAALTGFYLDQVTLQGGNGPLVFPSTLMNFKGAWSASATYATNDTVTSGSIGYVSLAANTNVPVTTTATWRPLAPSSASSVQYNSSLTDYDFFGDSIFIVGGACSTDGSTAGAITSYAISGSIGVFQYTSSPSLSAGEVIQIFGATAGSAFLNGQNIIISATGLTSTQFQGTVTGSGSATASMSFGCTNNWPRRFGTEKFANGGKINNLGISGGTSATMVANYTASVHPHTFAVTGNPCYVFTHTGVNDAAAPLSLATVEANLKSVWASAHTDGCTVVAFTNLYYPNSLLGYYQAQLSNWTRAQKNTSTTTTGQYADSIIDIASVVNNPYDPLMIQQSGTTGHPTEAGAAALADFTNTGLANQGSAFTTISGMNVFQGPQTVEYLSPTSLLQSTGNNGWMSQNVFTLVAGFGSDYPYVAASDGTHVASPLYTYQYGTFPGLVLASAVCAGWNAPGGGTSQITGAMDTSICRDAAGVIDLGNGTSSANTGGFLKLAGMQSAGTKFTTSGCSVSSTTGGATAGIFTLGANTCTVVITMNGATGLTATNGWTCQAHDRTAIADLILGESSSTTTTASIVIPVTAGATDVISFSCEAF